MLYLLIMPLSFLQCLLHVAYDRHFAQLQIVLYLNCHAVDLRIECVHRIGQTVVEHTEIEQMVEMRVLLGELCEILICIGLVITHKHWISFPRWAVGISL